ncbi:MAG: hypothetical protein IIC53_00075 [Proteobacteria bacterium]|nr:hypothetical protein [Pseudomonadota bacterium]
MKTKAPLRRIIRLVPAGLLAAVIGAAPAWGVEALQNGFALWDEKDGIEALRRLDMDPATPGRELIVAKGTAIFTDLGTTVRSQVKVFARVMTADGSSEIGRLSQPIAFGTSPYPDPGLAANQEGGGNETVYGGEFRSTVVPAGFTTAQGVDRIMNQAFDVPFGFGFAENTGAITRTLVIGLGIEGNYGNFTEPYVEVGRVAFFSFDAVPSAGEFDFLCAKGFAVQSGDWFLEIGEAGVGNFLAGARVDDDEIRVVEYNDTTEFARYRYFDPTDCSLLDEVFVNILR